MKRIVALLLAAAVVLSLCACGATKEKRLKKQAFDAATALLEEGKYEEALAAFESLDDYEGAAEKIEQCKTGILDNKYDSALALMKEGKYEDALALFRTLDYKDSMAKARECETAVAEAAYHEALTLMEEEKYVDAGTILKELNYKDSAEKFEECRAAAPYEFVNIGDLITFGKFEQDNVKENGPEPITWRVLDKQDGKVLIITEKVLEKSPFFAIYWKRSYIGGYLNSAFLYDFTPEEKEKIIETKVTADAHPAFPETDQGADTKHKLFLLSVDEVNRYFADNDDRKCYASDFVIHEGLETESDGRCDWWLRTACKSWSSGAVIANVDPNGMVNMSTHNCRMGLRPACWIQLEG